MSFGEMFIKHLLFWEMFTKHLEIEGCVICSMQSAVKVISVSFFKIFYSQLKDSLLMKHIKGLGKR